MELDFSRCRDVWVPDDSDAGGFWNPPLPHVKIGVEWIVEHPYALLADDLGGMKTAQAVIAAQFLSEMGIIDRVIVVCPASVRPVWADTQIGQLPELLWKGKRCKVSEYHQRVKSWIHEPDGTCELRIIVTNVEFIRGRANLATLLPYCGPKTLLIVDESSSVRTWNSLQTKAAMILRWQTNAKGHPILGQPRCGRVLEMNGTPLAEGPMDMFSQMNLLHPSVLDCRYVTHYRARYATMKKILGAGGRVLTDPYGRPVETIDGWHNLDDLQRRCAPYVLRREAKELGIDFALPPVPLQVTLKDSWPAYKSMRDDLIVWLEKGGVAVAKQAAAKVLRLAQITSGFLGGIEDAGIDDDPFGERYGETLLQLSPPEIIEVGREKLDFALEWHQELLRQHPDLKLLTWCRWVPELRRYLAEVKRFGHQVGAACGESVLGGRKDDERAEALRLLHPKTAPAGAVTVGATQGTGAMGLNFTACRTVLDMSYDYSSFKKKQGDARVNRPGQRGMVSFYYLVAVGPKGQATIDKTIMLARLGKQNLNDWTTAAWVKALKEE